LFGFEPDAGRQVVVVFNEDILMKVERRRRGSGPRSAIVSLRVRRKPGAICALSKWKLIAKASGVGILVHNKECVLLSFEEYVGR